MYILYVRNCLPEEETSKCAQYVVGGVRRLAGQCSNGRVGASAIGEAQHVTVRATFVTNRESISHLYRLDDLTYGRANEVSMASLPTRYSSMTLANFSFMFCIRSSYFFFQSASGSVKIRKRQKHTFLLTASSPSVGSSNFMLRSLLWISLVASRTLLHA